MTATLLKTTRAKGREKRAKTMPAMSARLRMPNNASHAMTPSAATELGTTRV
jgi:hypothetical protein